MIVSTWRNLWCLSATKNQPHPSYLLRDIANLLFWVPWACLATYTQSNIINLKKTFAFVNKQKINFIPHVLLETLKRYGTYFGYFGHACLRTLKMIVSNCRTLPCYGTYFGYFEHACLRTLKMVVSNCRTLQCLSACKK